MTGLNSLLKFIYHFPIQVTVLTINGNNWNSTFIPQDIINNGGNILFRMGPKPNVDWVSDSKVPQ